MPDRELGIEAWWNLSLVGITKSIKQQRAALMIYTTWNICKERNRRVFKGVRASPHHIVALIKEVELMRLLKLLLVILGKTLSISW